MLRKKKKTTEPDLDEFKPNLPGKLEVVPVNTSSSYRPFGDDAVDILGMDDSVSSPEQKRESTAAGLEPPAKKVRYTRRCPGCESGMNAPGIRHSASCKKAFEASSSPSVELVRSRNSLCKNLRRRLRMRLSDPSRGFQHCCRMLRIWHSRRQTLMNRLGICLFSPSSLPRAPQVS